MASRVEFDLDLGKGTRRTPRAAAEPLRILVIADLRADARPDVHDQEPLSTARVASIDVDTFDAVFASLSPELALPSNAEAGNVTRLSFTSMDDFHPDRLYDSLQVIVELRRSRDRLADVRSFESEKARLLGTTLSSTPEPGPEPAREDHASTLGRLLGARPGGGGARPAEPAAANLRSRADSSDGFESILRAIVTPYISHGPGAEQSRLMASLDVAIGAELRRVLHAPAFQRLEAAWRGIAWLVRQNAVGDDLKVSVLDASRAELVADLRACGGELERSRLYRLVVDREVAGPSGKPFSLIVGDLSFAGTETDVSLLAGLGAIAASAGGCFLGAADPALIGAPDLVRAPHKSAWSAPDPVVAERMALLRASAVAPFIGLALPRVLGRLPYGKRSDAIESFDFTELASDPPHAAFLWLNPAFACAQLIASAFAQDGWGFALGAELELGDLPLAIYQSASGDLVKPCAEVELDYGSAEQVLRHGLMSFMSYRDRNAVRLTRFQSIASPPAALAGPWG